MSTLEDLDDLEREEKDEKKKEGDKDEGDKGKKDSKRDTSKDGDKDTKMEDGEDEGEEDKPDDTLDAEILHASTRDVQMRKRLLEHDLRIMTGEYRRLGHEQAAMQEKIKDNKEKIENNRYVWHHSRLVPTHIVEVAARSFVRDGAADHKFSRQLPYLVANVVELLDLDVEAEAVEEGANIDLDATRVGKSAVIKTSTRQTIFLPLIGLVDHTQLKPGDLIGVNKDSYLVLDTLPAEYDSRVKAMEVDEKPTEKYTDVGGLGKQIEELVEAVVWPMKEAERFKKIGIKAPKGMFTNQHLITTSHFVLQRDLTYIAHRRSDVRSAWNRQDSSRPSVRRAN